MDSVFAIGGGVAGRVISGSWKESALARRMGPAHSYASPKPKGLRTMINVHKNGAIGGAGMNGAAAINRHKWRRGRS